MCVRFVTALWFVEHHEGEKGAERRVRVVRANGAVKHYLKARRALSGMRMVTTDGMVEHYEKARSGRRPQRGVCVRFVLTALTIVGQGITS